MIYLLQVVLGPLLLAFSTCQEIFIDLFIANERIMDFSKFADLLSNLLSKTVKLFYGIILPSSSEKLKARGGNPPRALGAWKLD
jgi:hypothetical protein